MIRLLVEGLEDDPNKSPLDVWSAAAAVGYRRKAARRLSVTPEFVAAYQAARAGKNLPPAGPTLENVACEVRRLELARAVRAGRADLIRMPPRAPEPAK
jgi:hypothetical protein